MTLSINVDNDVDYPYDDFDWKTEKTTWDELIQVRKGYNYHARGFVIANEIWLDKYSVWKSHLRLWNNLLDEYYPGGWKEDDERPRGGLFWAVTCDEGFIIDYPHLGNCSDVDYVHAVKLMNELEVPDDATLIWNIDDNNQKRVRAKWFRMKVNV